MPAPHYDHHECYSNNLHIFQSNNHIQHLYHSNHHHHNGNVSDYIHYRYNHYRNSLYDNSH
jgi:hypothetical protein